jgi:translation initiation factor SUI1
MLILNSNINENKTIDNNTKIHIRFLKRTNRKSFTIIQGLKFDQEKTNIFIKKMKTKFCCAGYIKEMEEFNGEVIQFTGDFRTGIKDILINEYKFSAEDIIMHGFE